MLKVDIVCSSRSHPVWRYLDSWVLENGSKYNVVLHESLKELNGGNILFLISCSELVKSDTRDLYEHVIVLHASDLPKGRGWSPHVWAIVEGAEKIVLSAIKADDPVDSGDIYLKKDVNIPKTALFDEINHILFTEELVMISKLVEMYPNLTVLKQDANIESSYYRKRVPSDSEVDPFQTIVNQFDLIRVCDPDRYPAYFNLRGAKYKIILEKVHENN